jgi:hypothetical protein
MMLDNFSIPAGLTDVTLTLVYYLHVFWLHSLNFLFQDGCIISQCAELFFYEPLGLAIIGTDAPDFCANELRVMDADGSNIVMVWKKENARVKSLAWGPRNE